MARVAFLEEEAELFRAELTCFEDGPNTWLEARYYAQKASGGEVHLGEFLFWNIEEEMFNSITEYLDYVKERPAVLSEIGAASDKVRKEAA